MKKNIFFILVAIFLVLTITQNILAISPSEIGDWWGRVTINGTIKDYGTIVDAYISEVKVASDTVGTPNQGYYLIHVPGKDSDKITFKVCGIIAEENIDWGNWIYNLDLSINKLANGASCEYNCACSGGYCCSGKCASSCSSSSSDDSPSGGGGSSGGGGGSSSSSGGSSGGGSTPLSSSTSGSTSNEQNKENETISLNETEESSSTSFLTGAVTGLGEFTKSRAGITSIIILVIIGGATLFFNFKKKSVKEVENPEEESSEEKEEDSSEEPEEETNEENQNDI